MRRAHFLRTIVCAPILMHSCSQLLSTRRCHVVRTIVTAPILVYTCSPLLRMRRAHVLRTIVCAPILMHSCSQLLSTRRCHVARTMVSAPIPVLCRPECYRQAIICMKSSGNLRKRSGAVSCILTLCWLMRYRLSRRRIDCAPGIIRTIIHAPHIVSSWYKRSSATQLCHLQRIRVLTEEAVVQSRHTDLAVDPDENVLQLAV